MLKFCVKVFTVSVFVKPLMDFIHVWHGDRNLCKILRGAISGHRLRIFLGVDFSRSTNSLIFFLEFIF